MKIVIFLIAHLISTIVFAGNNLHLKCVTDEQGLSQKKIAAAHDLLERQRDLFYTSNYDQILFSLSTDFSNPAKTGEVEISIDETTKRGTLTYSVLTYESSIDNVLENSVHLATQPISEEFSKRVLAQWTYDWLCDTIREHKAWHIYLDWYRNEMQLLPGHLKLQAKIQKKTFVLGEGEASLQIDAGGLIKSNHPDYESLVIDRSLQNSEFALRSMKCEKISE